MKTLHTAEILYSEGKLYFDYSVLLDKNGFVLWSGYKKEFKNSYDKLVYHQILFPAVINCHTHLTDSFHSEPIQAGNGLFAWVQELVKSRQKFNETKSSKENLQSSVKEILLKMKLSGTCAIAEVSNNFETLQPVLDSGLNSLFCYELIGFKQEISNSVIAFSENKIIENEVKDKINNKNIHNPENLIEWSFSAHAPYSVSLELLKKIKAINDKENKKTFQHLAEDQSERELYLSNKGEMKELLNYFNADDPSWVAPNKSAVMLYEENGLLDKNYVGVHLTDCSEEEIKILSKNNCSGVLSPITNMRLTGRLPNYESIVKNDLKFGFGTDGLGSNFTWNVFEEAKVIYENWYGLDDDKILMGLTKNGATILDFYHLGFIPIEKNYCYDYDGIGEDKMKKKMKDKKTDVVSIVSNAPKHDIAGFVANVLVDYVSRELVV